MAPLFHDIQHSHNLQQQRLCLFVGCTDHWNF